MADTRYYVVGDHDAWMVDCEANGLGPYGSCEEAVIFAIDAAQKLCRQGQCVHVCVVDDDGRIRPKWTHCGWRKAT
jgi:hypothetical protein